MIKVSSANLSFYHDGQRRSVLHDISFEIEAQGSCAIIGPSGCGKTSLLLMLAGILQPDSGTIGIDGNPRCGTILQNYGLFPWKTVTENIGLGLTLQKVEKAAIGKAVTQLLEEMDLDGFGDHFPGQLSGGMQQRVALARALAVRPEILFMDEPLSSLDALTRERLQNLILDITRKRQITTVLVTHSIEEAVFLGAKIIILSSRPARIIGIVDNPGTGSTDYRLSDQFFKQCIALRELLRGEFNGQEA
jgi:ABC-type nitrate/sulfonate/bicarbonate transport system ATPase subunit